MMEERHMDVVPGLEGIAAAQSSISYIDGEKGILEYRGINIEELCEKSTFLEVSYLLLFDKLPNETEFAKFSDEIKYHTRLKQKLVRMMEFLPESGHPMDYLQASVSAMGMFYPARDTLDEKVRHDSVIKLIAKLPTIVATSYRLKHGDAPIAPNNDLSFAANFYYMLFEKVPEPEIERMLDVMLILHGDHTMNASTFSSRVVGSTLADPYTIVAAAIGTLSGPLHGGANERVITMLHEIGTKDKVEAYIDGKIKNKEKIMGIGHRIYKTKDPRADILQKFAHSLLEKKRGESKLLEVAEEVERVVRDRLSEKKIYPNVDFYSGIVFEATGISPSLFTPIFAMGRVSGWLSHWLEQLKTNRIFRPDQDYVGTHNQTYSPIKERK